MGDGIAPFGVVLLGDDLSSDVGDDRTEPGQFPGTFGQSCQGGQGTVMSTVALCPLVLRWLPANRSR